MTEPIKQEIINNIFENGDKLITGPILQTVLIDMIDDVNVKDQEILSKTGSWDEAATQIPNLATKEEVTNLSESVARDLENVVGGDLTGYATEQWVESQGYLKEHQDISNLATKTELTEAKNNLQGNITSLSESVARDLANVDVDLTGYATETWVQSQDYASKSYVNDAISSSSVDLTGYATETWVQSQGYLTEHQDISGLATKAELTSVSESVQTDITNLSESVANSAVWKKGEGTDSIVQAIADGTNLPTATGKGALATGRSTDASGENSHAEGSWTQASGHASHAEGDSTKARGTYSHAEGIWTQASGQGSHAEGHFTGTSNDWEHAEGTYNHNSPNQIFSIGAGEFEGGVSTRRNAVSVLAVPNADTRILTSSFFVQNIGGYDGTNPTPGTNDLATVINNLPSGGGSSETLWKKGEGQDSLVQAIADGTNLPTATGKRAIATGYGTYAVGNNSHAEGQYTQASGPNSHAEGYTTSATFNSCHAEGDHANAWGDYSHAEGSWTTALGQASHAEGRDTEASGSYSHAEGYCTTASNAYEHVQGRYNHSSENQIFSIGTGNSDSDRRNAVSVLEVDNSGSYTSSFFVQNVGGYDGTNPTPGTNDLATVINGMSTGGGSSETLWKKGTGKDSIVQILTGADEPYTSTAKGTGAVAIGSTTQARGDYSYAEGGSTRALGLYSHAEGSGTEASNDYEHAQGKFNHSSPNQIFSVGAGEMTPDYHVNSRNAVSILVVPNSETQINTASFFVQNVGGYDGTNPTPGTNDLATVLNNTETWTFTLEDGSTVTKTIIMR